jgi:penicillin-binding protein 1C
MRLRPVSVPSADRTSERLISPRSAFWITDILSDPDAREYIFGRGGSLDFPFPVAAKTGTSEGYHDNWAIGYTRDVTVGVWVGNFDRTPLTNSTGVTGAGPIFHSVMLAAQHRVAGEGLIPDEPVAVPQDGLARTPICALSGMPANPWCPSRTTEWLPSDTPGIPCSWHHLSEDGVVVVWPPEYRQWASDQKRGQTPFFVASAHPTPKIASHLVTAHLSIQNPPDGATYLIDPTLRSQYQSIAFRAAADREAGTIAWSVDGQHAGTSESDKPLRWQLTPGEHTIAATDTRGQTDEVKIVVK